MTVFIVALRREIKIIVRQAGDSSLVIMFFVVISVLFPLGIGSKIDLLAQVAPTVIWIAALLSVLLSLEHMFSRDFEDGSLEQLALSPQPLIVVVLAKLASHWLTSGLPLMVTAPVIAILYNLPNASLQVLLLSMALGTPALSLIGGLGAALTLGTRRGGLLRSFLVLPFVLPVLIFGSAASNAAINGLSAETPLLLLGAILAVTIAIVPVITTAAIRQALD